MTKTYKELLRVMEKNNTHTKNFVELGEFYSESVTRPDLWSDVCGAYTAASIVMAPVWRPN